MRAMEWSLMIILAVAMAAAAPPSNTHSSRTVEQHLYWKNSESRFNASTKYNNAIEILNSEPIHKGNLSTEQLQSGQSLQDNVDSSRVKRYALAKHKWPKRDFTYKISKYTKQLDKSLVDDAIRRAVELWSEVAPITFTRKESGPVDIDVSFVPSSHPPCQPLGDELAHAPEPSSKIAQHFIHFNDDKKWSINSWTSIVKRLLNVNEDSIFRTATHEFGHVLGLLHSETVSAALFPSQNYQLTDTNFKLHADNIAGIQALYGAREGWETEPVKRIKDLCDEAGIDAVLKKKEGQVYILKGDWYWDPLGDGYARMISRKWRGLPGHIDAAFYFPGNGVTYFYKGSLTWEFDQFDQLKEYYPKVLDSEYKGNIRTSILVDRWLLLHITNNRTTEPAHYGTEIVHPPQLNGWPLRPDAVLTDGPDHYFFFGTSVMRFKEVKTSPPQHGKNTGKSDKLQIWFEIVPNQPYGSLLYSAITGCPVR